MKRAPLFFALIASLVIAAPARAALDPARASSDAAEVLKDHRAFCTAPLEPLSTSSEELCEYASQIPDCAPLVDACDRALHKVPDPPPAWLKAFGAWLTSVFGGFFGALGKIGVWILLGLTLLFILIPLVKSLVDSKNRDPEQVGGPGGLAPMKMKTDADAAALSPEDDPERLLEEGRQLADRGELDRALYRYLHAALLALDKRGAVRIAKGTTHGEYVRTCNDVEAKAPLRDLVRAIDVVRFGGQAPSVGGVSVAAERAAWIVRRAAVALTMLALVFFVPGCQPQQFVGGHDPSGNEVFRALLEKQGAKVVRVPNSLAHLAIPKPEDIATTPALYVDVDVVPLAAESEAHLVSWVEAGGVLVLAGSPKKWPKELGAAQETSRSTDVEVKTYPEEASEEEDDGEEHDPIVRVDHGRLTHGAALAWHDNRTFVLATTGDDKDYVAGQIRGKGSVYGFASHDLLTNAGLAVPGNAAAVVAVLTNVPRTDFMFASAEDGYSPPTNPFSSLLNAGLGLPLAHALVAVVILFLAVGIRFARPRPEPPPERRAFTEHVAATAAVYERTKAAKHALASFSRFAELRLVKRLGKGAPDIVSLLAQRTGERVEECAHVWARGLAAREFEHDRPNGDEIEILRRLTAMYTKTVRSI